MPIDTVMGFSVIGLLVCACGLVGTLLLWAIRAIMRFEHERRLASRLEAAIEAGRIERDAEAHQLNLEATWRD